MGTEIENYQPGLPGLAPRPAAIRNLVDSFTMFDEGAVVVINRQPTGAERAALTARLGEIAPALLSIGASVAAKQKAAKLLGAFFAGYPSLLNADAPGLVTAYVADLINVPLFALERALDDIKHGRVMVRERGREMPLDRSWPPASTIVYDQAVRVMSDLNGEAIKIRRVLGPTRLAVPDVSPEQRAIEGPRIRAMADQAIHQLSIGDEADLVKSKQAEYARKAAIRRQRDDFDQTMLEQYRQLGVEPFYAGDDLVSPELAQRLNPAAFSGK